MGDEEVEVLVKIRKNIKGHIPGHIPGPQVSKGLDRKALSCVLVTAFLGTMGIGIIAPLIPFLVQPYIGDQRQLAVLAGLLLSAYAVCQFAATPVLGILSTHYGRRLLLLLCLLGSVVGYGLLGLGGGLGILFLGRIIAGLSGGSPSILFAYIADSVETEERASYFNMLGAAFGLGFMLGPLIGGMTAHLGYQVPIFAAAGITLANLIWSYFSLPETLTEKPLLEMITPSQLNPLRPLKRAIALPQLSWLLLATFLFALPFATFQTITVVLTKESLHWRADSIGLLLFAAGIMDIVVQGGLLKYLLPLLDRRSLSIGGLFFEIAGYILLALAASWAAPLPLFVGTMLFAFGDALVQPSVGGLLARAVGPHEQERIHGGNQSVQALARIIGPILGGTFYSLFGRAVPYWASAVVIGLAMLALLLTKRYDVS